MAMLCIDAGTSMIKTVAISDDGRELLAARQETKVSSPAPGHSEQDMDEVWDAVVTTVRRAGRQTQEDIRFIALTGQGHGCWLIDEEGRPTGPAILWNDARAVALVEQWMRSGVLEQAFRINGSLNWSGLPPAILSWLHEHDPERIERSATALYSDGWLFYRLTGEVGLDESDASVPFLDIRSRQYSPELLKLYDVEWAQRLLPDVRREDRRVAELAQPAATELGLPSDTPVVYAPFDLVATANGMGAINHGQAVSILGTTLCTETIIDDVNTDGKPAGQTLALPGRYLRAFPTLAGTEVIAWAQELLGLYDAHMLSELAVRADPGADGLSFMPYLAPAGERAPFLNAAARGSFMGLTLHHERPHMARAILEGLTMVIRDCLEATSATPTELGVCGGGANSNLWCQMIADVTGVPVFRSSDEEVGAKGAFLAGLVATGIEPDLRKAVDSYVHVRDNFAPNTGLRDRYEARYSEFLDLRATAEPAWARMAESRAAQG